MNDFSELSTLELIWFLLLLLHASRRVNVVHLQIPPTVLHLRRDGPSLPRGLLRISLFHGRSCEAPLEHDLGIWRLVVAIQLPAHEVLSESLRTGGTGRSHSTGTLARISRR